MARRNLRFYGDPVLRQKAAQVPARGTRELAELVLDMFENCTAEEGAGLAAPQIGVSLRVFVVDCPEDPEDPRLQGLFASCASLCASAGFRLRKRATRNGFEARPQPSARIGGRSSAETVGAFLERLLVPSPAYGSRWKGVVMSTTIAAPGR